MHRVRREVRRVRREVRRVRREVRPHCDLLKRSPANRVGSGWVSFGFLWFPLVSFGFVERFSAGTSTREWRPVGRSGVRVDVLASERKLNGECGERGECPPPVPHARYFRTRRSKHGRIEIG